MHLFYIVTMFPCVLHEFIDVRACIYICVVISTNVFMCDMMSEKIPYDIKSIIFSSQKMKHWIKVMIVKWTNITISKLHFINHRHNRNVFLAFYWHDDDPPSCKDNYLKLWFWNVHVASQNIDISFNVHLTIWLIYK